VSEDPFRTHQQGRFFAYNSDGFDLDAIERIHYHKDNTKWPWAVHTRNTGHVNCGPDLGKALFAAWKNYRGIP
jgi:hypothetical protein